MKQRKFIGPLMVKLVSCTFLVVMLLAGAAVWKYPSAHAASMTRTVSSVQAKHQIIMSSSGHKVPDALCGDSNVLVMIWYNNGNSCFGVIRFGYNGLDFNLFNVTAVVPVACIAPSWLKAYNPAGHGFISRFNSFGFTQGPPPFYQAMTQIDVTSPC